MATFKTLEIGGWLPAIVGMRHPLKSYDKSDTDLNQTDNMNITLGENDYGLAKRLCKAGKEHAKWMRQVEVWVEISAPRYWWSEFDTYKVSTTANSQSTMHKLKDEKLNRDSVEFNWGVSDKADTCMDMVLLVCSILQDTLQASEDKNERNEIHRVIKGLLPESFIQTRTVSLNYQVLQNMYNQRKSHRLPQWNTDFVNWVKALPYSEFITGEFDD